MSRLAASAATVALAILMAACGVKAPPRPPVEAPRPAAQPAAAQSTPPGAGADAASGTNCGPTAATTQGNGR
jgi:hypothetical protein